MCARVALYNPSKEKPNGLIVRVVVSYSGGEVVVAPARVRRGASETKR